MLGFPVLDIEKIFIGLELAFDARLPVFVRDNDDVACPIYFGETH